jgi:hypothetical protein
MLDHDTASALLAGLDGLRRDLDAGLARQTAAAVEAAIQADAAAARQAFLDSFDRMKQNLADLNRRTTAAINQQIQDHTRQAERARQSENQRRLAAGEIVDSLTVDQRARQHEFFSGGPVRVLTEALTMPVSEGK